MPQPHVIDPAILEAALTNLETRRTRIDDQIAPVRSMLGSGSRSLRPNGTRRRKYRMSAEGRRTSSPDPGSTFSKRMSQPFSCYPLY
jgi:hypothetical protein